jgi:hypothetical protein
LTGIDGDDGEASSAALASVASGDVLVFGAIEYQTKGEGSYFTRLTTWIGTGTLKGQRTKHFKANFTVALTYMPNPEVLDVSKYKHKLKEELPRWLLMMQASRLRTVSLPGVCSVVPNFDSLKRLDAYLHDTPTIELYTVSGSKDECANASTAITTTTRETQADASQRHNSIDYNLFKKSGFTLEFRHKITVVQQRRN